MAPMIFMLSGFSFFGMVSLLTLGIGLKQLLNLSDFTFVEFSCEAK